MSGKTILYVEDNALNRKMIRHLLRGTTYRLIEASDGEAGVAMAREQRPDLILMDVQLPKVSGIEATRTLRGEPSTANTPIIAITSFALTGDEQRQGRWSVGLPRETLQSVHPVGDDSKTGP
jgi:two-component system cell cycle response regulator DivK